LIFALFSSLLGPGQEQKAKKPPIFYLALVDSFGFFFELITLWKSNFKQHSVDKIKGRGIE
jgi:hypothetical protein